MKMHQRLNVERVINELAALMMQMDRDYDQAKASGTVPRGMVQTYRHAVSNNTWRLRDLLDADAREATS